MADFNTSGSEFRGKNLPWTVFPSN